MRRQPAARERAREPEGERAGEQPTPETRRFVPGVDGLLHVRAAGSGPPVLLLHPSPLSSGALRPVARSLAGIAATLALDTPGYGLSAPLGTPPGRMADYVPSVLALLDGWGVERAVVYGSATGAQLGIELARLAPARVAGLVVDHAAHFTAADRDRILPGYFPDLAPRTDGAHLVTGWAMMREASTVFPWHSPDAVDRLPGPAGAPTRQPASPEQIQARFLDLLRAGPTYQRAYRTAFANERAEKLAAVMVPVRVIRREDGLLRRFTDALLARPLPENVRRVDAPAGAEAHFEAVRAAVGELAAGLPPCPPPPPTGGGDRLWLATSAGALHARRQGRGAPTLVLHAPGRSSDRVALPKDRETLCPDLPGHGESRVTAGDVATTAALLLEALRPLSWGRFRIVADGASEALARRLAAVSERVEDVVCRPGPRLGVGRPPDVSPDHSGAHLLAHWQVLRDEAFAAGLDLDAEELQAALFDRLRLDASARRQLAG